MNAGLHTVISCHSQPILQYSPNSMHIFFLEIKFNKKFGCFICDEIGNGAQLIHYDVQFDVLTTTKITVFWDANVCSLVGSYQSFGYNIDGNSTIP